MSGLTCQHGDLTAMMRIVRKQVSEESGHIRTKACDAPLTSKRRTENFPQRGATEIELETAIDNDAAIQFWKRSGYQTRGILKNYYPGGLSAYAMMKRLDT